MPLHPIYDYDEKILIWHDNQKVNKYNRGINYELSALWDDLNKIKNVNLVAFDDRSSSYEIFDKFNFTGYSEGFQPRGKLYIVAGSFTITTLFNSYVLDIYDIYPKREQYHRLVSGDSELYLNIEFIVDEETGEVSYFVKNIKEMVQSTYYDRKNYETSNNNLQVIWTII